MKGLFSLFLVVRYGRGFGIAGIRVQLSVGIQTSGNETPGPLVRNESGGRNFGDAETRHPMAKSLPTP